MGLLLYLMYRWSFWTFPISTSEVLYIVLIGTQKIRGTSCAGAFIRCVRVSHKIQKRSYHFTANTNKRVHVITAILMQGLRWTWLDTNLIIIYTHTSQVLRMTKVFTSWNTRRRVSGTGGGTTKPIPVRYAFSICCLHESIGGHTKHQSY